MKKYRVFFSFFKLLLKFSDFVNSDDCIGKITSKSIRLFFFIKKKIEVNRRNSREKMRNSGNFF